MTDVSPSIIDYWQSHPSLRPLVDSGVLDFAIFDAAQPSEVQLTNSRKALRPGELVNPMLVLANYLFDSIPQDCFSVGGGTLYENLVTIRSPGPGVASSSGQPALKDLQVSLESHPTRADYYTDPAFDGILDGYRQRLDNVILLFPIDGMRCVRFFHDLSPRGTLFLIGDIGTAREDDLGDRTARRHQRRQQLLALGQLPCPGPVHPGARRQGVAPAQPPRPPEHFDLHPRPLQDRLRRSRTGLRRGHRPDPGQTTWLSRPACSPTRRRA